jgi:HSP20 family protein
MAKNKPPEAGPSAMEEFPVGWPRFPRWPERMARLAEQVIKLEEFDKDGKHIVRAELPGIDPDTDVDVLVDRGVLTISAERREETKSEEKGRYRSEFSYGSFSRTAQLPPGATEKDVTATYSDGILEITFPINAQVAASQKVPISRG